MDIQAHLNITEIIENFSLLDEWDDRYRYLIELGRALPPLPEKDHIEANRVALSASLEECHHRLETRFAALEEPL